ncbi:SDR family NAD(P)-dependent oxidoreductase [Neiella sp. HB171785]|uniref:SDR family NAD(P)-dependent oxidoreductase n=1 Tax=Neiella litorisoli TaxID=2771431 RepID=A0A8J6UII3_9GAMM|nr:SDR family NAD(P)-dependent oxidoreductase [Neiella litorisoli]MBD1388518.1 SDR family NAD(P)-dependent oxidoreductase [Neiella litorisoli]
MTTKPVVLITGATSGIGYQLARDYLQAGVAVIAVGRNKEQLVDLQQFGADAVCCDLADAKAWQACVWQLEERYPSIDTVILNAGVCHYVDDGDVDAEVLQQTLDVNVVAPVRVLQSLTPLLQRASKPTVAMVSSASVYLPFVRAEFYGASKAALQYMGHVLHTSLKPKGIQLVTVILGFIDTPLTRKNDFEMPMLATVDGASAAIRQGIARGSSEVHFPRLFCGILRMLHKLPAPARIWLAGKMVKTNQDNGSQSPTGHQQGETRT